VTTADENIMWPPMTKTPDDYTSTYETTSDLPVVIRNGIPYERVRDTKGRFLPMHLPPRLEACPWCKETVGIVETAKRMMGHLDGAGLYQVVCPACGASGPALGSAEDASGEWNEIVQAI